MFDDSDKAVLRDLARIAGREGLRFFVIGAGARFLVHDWRYDVAGGRGTTDWDIAVRVDTWQEYEKLRNALTREDAPFQRTPVAHKFVHVTGRPLDMVPFGGVEAEDRTVAYPAGGNIHSVLGFRECEQRCMLVDVGEGVSVGAVAPPGLVLLKANAYLERRPALTHDIQDIDFIARTYESEFDATTVFERAADVLQEEHTTYEHVGAYLLGRDTAECGFASAVLGPLLTVLGELRDPMSRAVDDVRGQARFGPDQHRGTIVMRYAAMSLGLGL